MVRCAPYKSRDRGGLRSSRADRGAQVLPPAGATVPPWLPAKSARVSNLPACCALGPPACAGPCSCHHEACSAPFGMAAPRQGLPVRLERAPHRGAAFALSNASKRARTWPIGSRSRGSLFIFRSSPPSLPLAPRYRVARDHGLPGDPVQLGLVASLARRERFQYRANASLRHRGAAGVEPRGMGEEILPQRTRGFSLNGEKTRTARGRR
jgi:hypothetical protein